MELQQPTWLEKIYVNISYLLTLSMKALLIKQYSNLIIPNTKQATTNQLLKTCFCQITHTAD